MQEEHIMYEHNNHRLHLSHREQCVFDEPRYILICNNNECRLQLPIGRPQYGERCPRCGAPMSCVRER